jgi:hypothetical protein
MVIYVEESNKEAASNNCWDEQKYCHKYVPPLDEII